MEVSKLTSAVEEFRSKIEPCWSEESAYKAPEILEYGPHISGGQCAVTCLVLMDMLHYEFPNESICLVSGQVQSTSGDVVIPDHGWLLVGSGENAVIIDPTADQADTIDEKVIIGTAKELEEQGLRYVGNEVEESHGEIEHPKRFKRYQILRQAWENKT